MTNRHSTSDVARCLPNQSKLYHFLCARGFRAANILKPVTCLIFEGVIHPSGGIIDTGLDIHEGELRRGDDPGESWKVPLKHVPIRLFQAQCTRQD